MYVLRVSARVATDGRAPTTHPDGAEEHAVNHLGRLAVLLELFGCQKKNVKNEFEASVYTGKHALYVMLRVFEDAGDAGRGV